MPYRDHGRLIDRRQELARVRRAELADLPQALRFTYVERFARTAAGGIGIAGASAMTIVALRGHGGARVLLASWIAMAVAFVAIRWAAPPFLRLQVARRYRFTADVRGDVTRFEQPAREAARELVDALERASVAAPLAAIALLAPLGLHLVFTAVMRKGDVGGFDEWIVWSAAIVGDAHLAVVWRACRFARALRRQTIAEIAGADDGWRAYRAALAWSLVPGALFFLIPPVLVAVTGLLFVPASFAWMRDAVVRERLAINAA